MRKKLTNSDESGIIDKLKSILNFDIEKIASTSQKEKFDMLKLLKKLYFIEKYGISRKKQYNEDDNVKTQYSLSHEWRMYQ